MPKVNIGSGAFVIHNKIKINLSILLNLGHRYTIKSIKLILLVIVNTENVFVKLFLTHLLNFVCILDLE